ncbi:MAG: hypothetical protein ACRDWT_19580 [Jatrophihabitantaceae bacterium]
MSTTKIARRIRARRAALEFDRALRNASPAMRQELLAASSREFSR